jgi:DNA helicase INO80
MTYSSAALTLFYGNTFKCCHTCHSLQIFPERLRVDSRLYKSALNRMFEISSPDSFEKGLTSSFFTQFGGYCSMELPNFRKLVSDCSKLKLLDDILKQLKAEHHRCLIFCQMTKMLDILEDFMSWRKYNYFRMDGSSSLSDRRDMVNDYQNNPNVFCFLLSTRAGGLGVTLTAADTVIFYDMDWNPTMDAQATDRVHRIGQTKKVTIYRLITRNTIEENILKRAKQKESVQSTVYSGGAFKADSFKPKDVSI